MQVASSEIGNLFPTNDLPSCLFTEDSCGMGGKVNLPSPTADSSWHGLEGLYIVNGSVYEYRQNYRLSLVDWTNYLEDVDRVFALLNGYHEQNRTNKTKTAQSDGFLAVSAELSVPVEMAPTESDEDPSCMAGEATHLTQPLNPAFEPTNIQSGK